MTGDATRAVFATETHISVLVGVGDRVYKAKKPVRFTFCDFSTVEARRQGCAREVELNRRMAPDVYLGVGTFADPTGGEDEPVVVMRRMPENRRLATLVADQVTAGTNLAGTDLADTADDAVATLHRALEDVAGQLVALHRSAPVDATTAAGLDAGQPESMLGPLVNTFDDLSAFAPAVLDPDTLARMRRRAVAFVAGRTPLFEARRASGLVVDGHGDVQAEDIFVLDDGPRVLDCIEFDDRLRLGDALADVAFLAMDLERLGAPALARHVADAYDERCPEATHRPLLHWWVAERALVRAKVACLRLAQLGAVPQVGDVPQVGAEAESLAARARSLAALADAHLAAAEVRLVLVGGPPGTGKSTVATAVAARRGWTVVRSDEVRKELAGVSAETSLADRPGQGWYDEGHTDATYQAMLGRAAKLLGDGSCVVLDASWTSDAQRRLARSLAKQSNARLVELRCEAPVEVGAARIAERARRGGDPSDADVDVAVALRGAAEPWPTAQEVDTDRPVDEVVGDALDLVGPGCVDQWLP